MKNTNNGILGNILWIISLIFAVALIICFLSPMISPKSSWIIAFFGLAYPYIAAATFVLFVLLCFANIKRAAIIFIMLLLNWGNFQKTFSIKNHNSTFSQSEENFKIMSYNVKLFDLYSWKNPGKIKDSIIEYINQQQPDILCIQEFYRDTSTSFNCEKDIKQKAEMKYSYVDIFLRKKGVYEFGMAIFSKYPIINSGSIKCSNEKIKGNYVSYVDIKKDTDTIRIYNAHLQSFKFSNQNEVLFHENELTNEQIKEESKNLIKKIRTAFILRAEQVDDLKKQMKKSPYKFFVCGDFNDTPVSYSYRMIRGDLNDAFLDAGKFGFGKTYQGVYPSFRIDFILYPDEYQAANFEIGKVKFSDHYPISCCFRKSED